MHSVNARLDKKPMNRVQIKMARAALDWTVRDLAAKSGVTANTINRIENGADAKASTLEAIRQALAPHVEFIQANGGGPGVRLRRGDAEK